MDNKLAMSTHHIAYLDFLGMKNLIEQDSEGRYLNKLNYIYQQALKQAEFYSNKKNANMLIKTKIFSDNIVIYIPENASDNNGFTPLEQIIVIASYIQNVALEEGFLSRGAITTSQFYGSELFVYGPALTEAVIMEEKEAIYPRIIIRNPMPPNINGFYVERDRDGLLFVNNYALATITGNHITFQSFKDNMLSYLTKYKDDCKVRQKVMWAITFFNAFLKKLPDNKLFYKPLIVEEEVQKATK